MLSGQVKKVLKNLKNLAFYFFIFMFMLCGFLLLSLKREIQTDNCKTWIEKFDTSLHSFDSPKDIFRVFSGDTEVKNKQIGLHLNQL